MSDGYEIDTPGHYWRSGTYEVVEEDNMRTPLLDRWAS